MDKLVLAEDTSNIDMSSDGLREQKKKRRRVKAKKVISSSSDEDVSNDEENDMSSNKILPECPQIGNFVSKLHSNRHNIRSVPNTSYTLSSE